MKAFQIMMVMSLVVLLGACAASYKHVSVQELHSTKEPNYILLDVRQPEEYDEVQVANSMLIPLGELALRTSELSKDVPLYVICRSGNRSKQASDILVKAGFKDVRNVEGGILAWQAAGFAVE